MNTLDVQNSVDPASWNNDVIRFKGCSLHSYEWSQFSAQSNNARPLYFRHYDSTGKISSLSFGLLKTKTLAGIPILKSLSFGSLPAVTDKDACKAFIEEVKAYCRDNKITTLEINSFGTPHNSEILIETGFIISKRWEFVGNIDKGEEELWADLHSKKRNLIRKAQKAGVQVERKYEIKDVMDFRRLAHETWQRKTNQGISFPKPASEKYYKLLKKGLIDTGLGRLYLACENSKLIAGAFFVGYNNSAYYMLSSSTDDGLKNAAPDLILWTSMTDYQKEGYKVFNLGGLSEGELNGRPLEESGLYHFKIRFSAEPVPCLKGKMIFKPCMYSLYKLLIKARSFMPVKK